MINRNIKPCPVCKIGKLRLIHYANLLNEHPELLEEIEPEVFWPIVTYKKIECSNCGAASCVFDLTIDDAVNTWNSEDDEGNRQMVVQFINDELI